MPMLLTSSVSLKSMTSARQPAVELPATFALNFFAGEFIKIVACVNNSRRADTMRPNSGYSLYPLESSLRFE